MNDGTRTLPHLRLKTPPYPGRAPGLGRPAGMAGRGTVLGTFRQILVLKGGVWRIPGPDFSKSEG